MNITISCAIMHASFSKERRQSVQRLQYQLYSQGVNQHWDSLKVVEDGLKQGAWWTAKRCWDDGCNSSSTHHIVMQDDIVVCNDFVSGVKDVISAYPDEIISLFHGPRKAFDGSCRWGLSEGVWGQAICMPVSLVKEFMEWEKFNVHPSFPHDDSRVSLFAVKTKRTVKVPFPNLVDHRDTDVKSVMGNKWNKPRVSSDFMGARSPHDFDWSEKDRHMKSINSYTQYNKYLING